MSKFIASVVNDSLDYARKHGMSFAEALADWEGDGPDGSWGLSSDELKQAAAYHAAMSQPTVGRIIRSSRQVVEGTHKQEPYGDSWLEAVQFEYDGEIDDDVLSRIRSAVKNSNLLRPAESSWGQLSWHRGDDLADIDADRKLIYIRSAVGICD